MNMSPADWLLVIALGSAALWTVYMDAVSAGDALDERTKQEADEWMTKWTD